MRMPMKARSIARLSTLVAASSLVLSACSSEITAPPTSSLSPTAANLTQTVRFNPSVAKKLVPSGKTQTYVFTIDPNVDNTLMMGAHAVTIPASAVCSLAGSSYGLGTWNTACTAERLPFTITATIFGNADGGRLEFSPALRFSPTTNVQIWMYSKKASPSDKAILSILYCPTMDKKSCYDESLTDASLAVDYNRKDNVVFRRIKHFSGYVVAEFLGVVPLDL